MSRQRGAYEVVRRAGQEALYREGVPQLPEGAFPLRILYRKVLASLGP